MQNQSQRISLVATPIKAKWKRWPLAAIALCTLGAIGLSPITLPILAQSRPPQPPSERMLRTLTVTGQCTEKIASTIAQVQLGVEAQGKTAQQVQQEVAKRSSKVVALLKSRNVEKLQTTGINLNPQYSYNNNKQTLTGYQASNTVSFRVPIPQAGTIMDDAVKAGASRIDSLSFTASDQAIADAQKVALRKATLDAQDQSKAVLDTLGFTSKDIVSIQVNGSNTPPPRPYPVSFSTSTKLQGEAVSSPVEGGEQPVQASVTLQISY
jgi:uncharacterized protein